MSEVEIMGETIKKKKKNLFQRIGEAFAAIPKEHHGFGKQVFMLARDDLLKTYKGAVIGPFWAVMKPLFNLFVYWFAFSVGLRGGSTRVEHGIPFFVFMMVGFLPWVFMSDTVSRGSRCLRDNRQFVNKISFPVSAIMTYTTLAKFYVQIFLFSLVYIYLVCTGYMPSLYNIQVIGYAALMFLFYLALTWSLAPMSAFSKDFESLIATIMSGFFWLSGVCFDSYTIDSVLLRKILLFNPMTFFVNGYRKSLLYHQWFFEGYFYPNYENLIFLLELIFVILLGIYNYNRLKKTLPDVL